MRLTFAIGFLLTSCSFITDFDPGKANSGGAGGTSGAGGMSGTGGTGGNGGMSIDARPDSRPIDAAIDARPDTPPVCTMSSQCDDGIACTTDRCNFPGTCSNMPDDQFCVLQTNLCTRDSCAPAGAMPDSCGCVHPFIDCSSGEICITDQGCVQRQCSSAIPCPAPADPCKVAHCEGGRCSEVPRCSGGQTCVYMQDPNCGAPIGASCQ